MKFIQRICDRLLRKWWRRKLLAAYREGFRASHFPAFLDQGTFYNRHRAERWAFKRGFAAKRFSKVQFNALNVPATCPPPREPNSDLDE